MSPDTSQKRPLRIGIDLTLLRPDRLTGVERYAQNLARTLVERESGFHWVLFFRGGVPEAFVRLAGRYEARISPFKNRVLTDQLWLPLAARRARLDLLHSVAYPTPLFYRGPSLLTVHDAAMWRHPDCVSRGARWYYRPLFPRAIRRAARVVTVSEFSQRELCEIFGMGTERVVPILEGLDGVFDEPPPRREAPEPFVLTVGTIEPRKNLETLIEAMYQLPGRHTKVPLLVVGREGWQKFDSLDGRRPGKVRWLGPVSDSALKELYRTATVFALPSVYEGFGLPLVEAMSQGAPVLCSNAAALPEIGGDACLYAEPRNPADWTAKLTLLLDDPERRVRLSNRGIAWSSRYRWADTASRIAKIYRSIAKTGQPGVKHAQIPEPTLRRDTTHRNRGDAA